MYLNKENQQLLLNEIESIFDTLKRDLYRNEFVDVRTIDDIENSLKIMQEIIEEKRK